MNTLNSPVSFNPPTPPDKAQQRETLRTVLENELANLPSLLAELDPKERAAMLCKLLPYVMDREGPTITSLWDS